MDCLPTRVAVALTPRLFADAVAIVLARPGRDVRVLPRSGVASGGRDPGPFDLGIVSEEAPAAIVARIVIALPGDPSRRGTATVRSGPAMQPVVYTGLQDLVALVDRLCRVAPPGMG